MSSGKIKASGGGAQAASLLPAENISVLGRIQLQKTDVRDQVLLLLRNVIDFTIIPDQQVLYLQSRQFLPAAVRGLIRLAAGNRFPIAAAAVSGILSRPGSRGSGGCPGSIASVSTVLCCRADSSRRAYSADTVLGILLLRTNDLAPDDPAYKIIVVIKIYILEADIEHTSADFFVFFGIGIRIVDCKSVRHIHCLVMGGMDDCFIQRVKDLLLFRSLSAFHFEQRHKIYLLIIAAAKALDMAAVGRLQAELRLYSVSLVCKPDAEPFADLRDHLQPDQGQRTEIVRPCIFL